MTRLEELAQKHFPLVAYDEALEFGKELIEECARIAVRKAAYGPTEIAEAIRFLAEEGGKK